MRMHFRSRHNKDTIVIDDEGRLPRCAKCGLFQKDVGLAHQQTAQRRLPPPLPWPPQLRRQHCTSESIEGVAEQSATRIATSGLALDISLSTHTLIFGIYMQYDLPILGFDQGANCH
jgi:hypothetical protein